MFSKLRTSLHSALLCTVSLLATASMAQTTINVGPGQPYTTIQSGIDAAANGDTVLVAPGTYNENIDFKGKAITVTSSGGAAVTTIDGGNKPGVATVVFKTKETSTSTISNFTIRGGGDTIFNGASDGGVFVSAASPTIQNNTITANYCHNIDVEFGDATILKNEVSGVLQNNQGSGTDESYCTFGSGVHLQGTGGSGTQSSIVGNIIENNLTGSGINIWAAQNVLISNNIIRNNTSGDPGSAFTSANSAGTVLFQNLIYQNTSNCGGALGFMDNGDAANPSILIANNTIVDNVTPQTTGGSECTPISQIYPNPYSYGESGPGAVFVNNIISGSTSYPAVNCSWFGAPSESLQPTFENNILYNAGGPFFGSHCVDVSGKYNNIVADPQFVSPSTGDYHLKFTSPGIDAGQNSALQTILTMTGKSVSTDFDGKLRIQDATGQGCIIDIGAYEYQGTQSCSTNETFIGSPNPSTYGQTVTFTARLSSSFGVPTGDVQFSDGGTILGTEAISSTGVSTFTTSQLSVGSHIITASYQPTGIFPPLSVRVTQVVNGAATNVALTCSANPIYVTQTTQLAAIVSSVDGTPTGSITFTDNGATLATQALAGGAANFTYTGSTAGTHTLTATFVPSGAFAGSSASCSETVNLLPSKSTLSAGPASSTYGSAVTLTATVSPATPPGPSTPSGTVTFYNGGSAIGTGTLANGVASLTLTTLPGGTDNLTCAYSGSGVYATSSCNTVPFLVNPAPSTTTLTASPNPAYATQTVILTATVSSHGTPVQPTSGTVTFYDSASSLGTQPLTASSTATLTLSTLAVGTHAITAIFTPGNNTFLTSTSPAVNEVILPSGFTIALAPGSIAMKRGATATVAIHLASVGNFAGPVSLTFGALPANATASINPSSVTLTAGGTGSSTLSLNTLLKSATAVNRTPTRPGSRALPAVFAAFALLFVPLGLSRRRKITRLLSFALLAFALQTTTGCTNAWYTAATVAPGTYELPVIATDANHNTQTATLTITVAP
ncbi:MAG TPA: Ig-like domain repeat protein [Bryocella sp.]|nr:Ig-like domain repeat protein [Bryocella sp.]